MDFIVENALKTAAVQQPVSGKQVGQANIKVIGVGGAGNNMVGWLPQERRERSRNNGLQHGQTALRNHVGR